MTDAFERLKIASGNNGHTGTNTGPTEWADDVRVSVVVPAETSTPSYGGVHLPDVRVPTNDRIGHKMAKEAQRRMALIVFETQKTALAVKSIRFVNTQAVEAVDQAQDEMMATLHRKARYPGMSEMMGDVIAQGLQQTIVATRVAVEDHCRRVMEILNNG